MAGTGCDLVIMAFSIFQLRIHFDAVELPFLHDELGQIAYTHDSYPKQTINELSNSLQFTNILCY